MGKMGWMHPAQGEKENGLVASSSWKKLERKMGWLHPAHGENEKWAECIQPVEKRKTGWLHPAHGENDKWVGCIQPMGKPTSKSN